MSNTNKISEIQSLQAQCNSVTVNLKEDVVLSICSILRNINLITDKKMLFNKQKGELVE